MTNLLFPISYIGSRQVNQQERKHEHTVLYTPLYSALIIIKHNNNAMFL